MTTTVRVELARPTDTLAVRRAVLAPGGALDMTDEQAAAPSVHLAARAADGRVVGSVHFDPRPCPWREAASAWQLRAMATHPDVRGTGAGRALVQDGMARALAAGGDLVWCNARSGAVGFYLGLGFTAVTEPFDEIGIPHVGMLRPLGAAATSEPDRRRT